MSDELVAAVGELLTATFGIVCQTTPGRREVGMELLLVAETAGFSVAGL